jgi:hypothetical protein
MRELIAIAFSPDGKLLAMTHLDAGTDDGLQIWDWREGKLVRTLAGSMPGGGGLRWSSDGRYLIGFTSDSACYWDLVADKTIALPFQATTSSSPASDWKNVVFGLKDRRHAEIIALESGKRALPPLQHEAQVEIVLYSPDVTIIATGSADRTARLWNAETGAPLGEPLKHTGTVTQLAFSPDGHRLATGTEDGCIQLWDVRSGLPLTVRFTEPTAICGLDFLNGGSQLLTGCRDGVSRRHEVPPLPTPAPLWLADLAEAVGGLRIAENDAPTRQGVPELRKVARDRSTAVSAVGPTGAAPVLLYDQFAEWFLADRATRTISAFSKITMDEGIAQLAKIGTIPTLEEAYRRRPTDLAIMDALAALYAKEPDSELQSHAKYLHALAKWNRESGNEKNMADFAKRLREPGGLLGRRIIAPRPKDATTRQIDLSEFYLRQSTVAAHTQLAGPVYGQFAKGLQEIDGIRYDIRGMVGLQSENSKTLFLSESGIPIHQKCTRLHFLHTTAWKAKDGVQIATYRLHYTNGETHDLPVVFNDDVHDNLVAKVECRNAKTVKIAASNAVTVRLFHRTYDNPRPEAEIATLEIISTNTTAAPFVAAITLE